MPDSPAVLLPGVDRAALAAAFGDRLRNAGVGVPTTALADLVAALDSSPRTSSGELYWQMRVTLVRRHTDLRRLRPGVQRSVPGERPRG